MWWWEKERGDRRLVRGGRSDVCSSDLCVVVGTHGVERGSQKHEVDDVIRRPSSPLMDPSTQTEGPFFFELYAGKSFWFFPAVPWKRQKRFLGSFRRRRERFSLC